MAPNMGQELYCAAVLRCQTDSTTNVTSPGDEAYNTVREILETKEVAEEDTPASSQYVRHSLDFSKADTCQGAGTCLACKGMPSLK